jgi:ABC-type uncharacterized transport system permease subunit
MYPATKYLLAILLMVASIHGAFAQAYTLNGNAVNSIESKIKLKITGNANKF